MFTAYTFLIHQYLEKRLVATGSKVNVSCELRHQLRCAWEIRNRRKVERTNSERRRYIGAQHVLHTESQASNVKYMVELGVASTESRSPKSSSTRRTELQNATRKRLILQSWTSIDWGHS